MSLPGLTVSVDAAEIMSHMPENGLMFTNEPLLR